MKRKIFWLLVVMVVGLISSNLLMGVPRDDWDKDNYGKVIGEIVDPDTGKPVNEIFIVEFFSSAGRDLFTRPLWSTRTDKRGYLSTELEPNIYCVRFRPESNNSKYSPEPHPYCNEDSKFIVKVERAKITEFRKKATIGGSLKVRLVNKENKIIEPNLVFTQNGRIVVSLDISNMGIQRNAVTDFANGEMTINSLYPGLYLLEVDFQGYGIGRKKKENVKVEKDKTTEVDIIVDLDDATGLEGAVFDTDGNFLNNAEVALAPIKTSVACWTIESYTNQNGEYRIKGVPEGLYRIIVSAGKKMYLLDKVKIEKGIMIKKDIFVNVSDK